MASGLGSAHRGYQYQDLATAYFLAQSLIYQFDEVTVDRKEYEGDRFDDLAIRADSRLVRRQFKHSADATRIFEIEDLITQRKDLRIDDLIACFKSAGSAVADEYRLCATWSRPRDPKLVALLEEIPAEPSFVGHPTRLYRLRGDLIWPEGGKFSWKPKRAAEFNLSQQDFLDFTARFVIELECPSFSGDLSNPGTLEQMLLRLLVNDIGVGQYPNQERNVVDVAFSLSEIASQARAGGQTLKPSEVVAKLRLRTDYGKVAQQFPLVKSELVNRVSLLETLHNQVETQPVIVFTGSPGSGKSWTLTCLAEQLKEAGHLVAKHYCYLEPGDPDVQKRITTDVLFANLIYELISSESSLREKHRPIYSVGSRELENILVNAIKLSATGRIVLIIDGIDHISRVLSESPTLAPKDTDIVKELAALNLPPGVCLVMGSQPGSHLDPLAGVGKNITIQDWSFEETTNLANRLGVLNRLSEAGFADIEKEFTTVLYERSEGNPLYATFLCRELLAKLNDSSAVEPIASLREAPVIAGSISCYYDYLLQTAQPVGASQIVADLLGLIDYGLTIKELQEIFPLLAHYIPSALNHLSPILKQVTSQGGVRIYHESFRRFIIERLRSQGITLVSIITPVIDWLTQRGFYKDSKAYRFLLPCLRRADRKKDILDLISFDFVSRSVEFGHPQSAIQANLMLATDVAAEELDWVSLTRLAELHRSNYTCFEEKLRDFDLYELYGRTFGEVFGMDALVERLLFEGRATLPAKQGLILCSLCDDAGQTPPWSEYLELERKNEVEDDSQDSSWEQAAIARFHGLVRLYGVEAMCQRLSDWLVDVKEPPISYLRGVLRRLAQFGGSDVLKPLLRASHITDEVVSVVRVELARILEVEVNAQAAREVATQAVQSRVSIDLAFECLSMGATPNEIMKCYPELTKTITEFDCERKYFEEAPMRSWVAAVGIAAATDPTLLYEVRKKIGRGSWYKNWLCFIVSLSEAEVKAKLDLVAAQSELFEAIKNLSSDTHPFKGEPRAIDLYSIREIIHQSIARALHLLQGTQQWEKVLNYLFKISSETNGYEKSSIGPIAPEVLIKLLLPYASNQSVHESTLKIIELLVQQAEKIGRFYEVHASYEMYLIQALVAGIKVDAARTKWQSVATYLCAYGFRKDSTISELLWSLPALGEVDLQRTRTAFKVVQPLVDTVVEHTERVEYAHGAWYAALCKVDPVAGLVLLARSLVLYGGVIDWRLESALEDVVDNTQLIGNPLILVFLEATCPIDGQDTLAKRRLAVIERLLKINPEIGQHHFRLLAAQIQGDSRKFNPAVWEQLQDFSAIYNIPLPPGRCIIGDEENKSERTYREKQTRLSSIFVEPPIFPFEASPLDLMKGLRFVCNQSSLEKRDYSKFINAFGYRLVELLDKGAEDEAIHLLHYFCREHHFYEDAVLIADVAEGLERHGYKQIASITFIFAYCYSRDGGGWLQLGGSKHLPWLMHAITLSQDIALHYLANEVAHFLEKTYVSGITRHLIQFFAAQRMTNVAFQCWEAAFEVIQHRLPSHKAVSGPFIPYVPEETPLWSIDEGLVSVLLARVTHPELERKVTALSGLAALFSYLPTSTIAPLRESLRLDTPITSVITILQLLSNSECPPYPISVALQNELLELSRCDIFGIRILAQALLERIGLTLRNTQLTAVNPVKSTLTSRQENAILSLDWGERVDTVSEIWPSFSHQVALHFNQLWERTESYKMRAQSRHEAAQSRVRNNMPSTPLLFWEKEIFECVFHEVLNGIESQLWAEGEWTPSSAIVIQQRVTPRLKLQIARWHSRVIRPLLPLPSLQQSGLSPAIAISNEDEYNGWYRCGYYERQLLFEEKVLGDLSNEVTIFAGVMFEREQNFFEQNMLPFGYGNEEAWWDWQNDYILLQPQGFHGPLVGLKWVQDFLGYRPVMMLPPQLARRCSLHLVNKWPSRLELVDSQGVCAVSFRWWNVRPVGDGLNEEIPILQGCDLIVRPDIFEQIRQLSKWSPIEVRQVQRSLGNE
ncbi:NACHT domain-containing protein [Desmonostoc muscorum LEGE 12446]|uniref:NACHT domain-containing protein n=1 Tax=Desmonostoc muscorum LEGE 12446 TaxID=1828758 RepID=A0A8J7CX25_DESMC|nr:NACHT domain-containing protein [Desmonostoc muscorum]MCF2151476.1 NACHT domain-containing protein [Desmonostoc muscorum LEGE 12446]